MKKAFIDKYISKAFNEFNSGAGVLFKDLDEQSKLSWRKFGYSILREYQKDSPKYGRLLYQMHKLQCEVDGLKMRATNQKERILAVLR